MSSVKEKAGQLMVFGFNGYTMTDAVRKMIHENQLGALILFSRNIESAQQLHQLTMNLQVEAKKAGLSHPLLICTDQENGEVRRLTAGATLFPGSMLIGATGRSDYAFDIGKQTGEELWNSGINWNLAPVVDVAINPDNPVINSRSFGGNPCKVAEMGVAFMKGTQEAGVIPTLKHFPGHGDTNIDSHLDLPVISHSLERLERVELYPFRKCIEEGADVIMTAHICFPAIESQYGLPATLSYKVLTGLLRKKMGFQGVITTDCMEMQAISKFFGTAKGAAMALKAGADLVMVSHTYEKQRDAIDEVVLAVNNHQLSELKMDQSIQRVRKLKEKYLSWQIALQREKIDVYKEQVLLERHRKTALNVYKEGITIVRNHQNLLPLSDPGKVLFLYDDTFCLTNVEDKKGSLCFFEEIIHRLDSDAVVSCKSDPLFSYWKQKIRNNDTDFHAVVILTAEMLGNEDQLAWVNQLNAACPVVVIAAKGPYILRHLVATATCLCTYERSKPVLELAIQSIFGRIEVSGQLPVNLGLESSN